MSGSLDIVFSSWQNFGSGYGDERLPVDVAKIIYKSLGFILKPRFVTENEVATLLQEDKGPLIIGINLNVLFESAFHSNQRLLTVGIQSYTRDGRVGSQDICLSSDYNPVTHFREPSPDRPGSIVINFSYPPSRIRPYDALTATGEKTIAVYFRNASYACAQNLMRDSKILSQNGYRFLASTGPTTSTSVARELERHFTQLPGSDFCLCPRWNVPKSIAERLKKSFLNANIILVTDDSIATAGDALNTGKPVLLLTEETEKEWIKQGFRHQRNIMVKFHKSMLVKNRTNFFSLHRIYEGWQPNFHDDWRDIGAHRRVIEGRVAELSRA